jgi:hypothetical protein
MDAISHWMYWIGLGLGALFFVAVVVAWWEHLGRQAAGPLSFAPAPPKVAQVDLNVDAWPEPAAAPASGDQARRQRALGDALERMTQPGALGEPRRGWVDTKPMIGLNAPRAETAPKSASKA